MIEEYRYKCIYKLNNPGEEEQECEYLFSGNIIFNLNYDDNKFFISLEEYSNEAQYESALIKLDSLLNPALVKDVKIYLEHNNNYILLISLDKIIKKSNMLKPVSLKSSSSSIQDYLFVRSFELR